MADIEIQYKGNTIKTTSAEGTTTLHTEGKYMEDDVDVVYTKTSGTEGTPIATKGAVSNHSIDITPSVTNSAGYIPGGTKTGTAVTVSASELVSGDKPITANGSNIDVTEYETVSVNVPPSTPTLETYHVCMGQFTPSASGGFQIDVNVGETIASVKFGVIWLDDPSVVPNYSSQSIVLMSCSPVYNGYSTINNMNGNAQAVQSKTAYGLQISRVSDGSGFKIFRFNYRSYSQWLGQPEKYNYFGIYTV